MGFAVGAVPLRAFEGRGGCQGAADESVTAWDLVRGALRSRLATRLSALMVSVLANGSFRLVMCIGFCAME